MGELAFKIDGFDIMAYIVSKGIKWTRNDIDSEEAGMALDGTLHRDRVIMRRKLEVTIKPNLNTAEVSAIQKAIYPQWINVEFLDPLEGKIITRKFYSNNVPATVFVERDGKVIWDGFSFPLIEQGVSD